MAQKSRPKLNGILVGDPRATVDALWSSESSYTQADPVPGLPEAWTGTDPSRLILMTSGVGRTVDTDIRCTQSGTGIRESGRLAWRDSGDAAYRGLEPPVAINRWEPIEWSSSEVLSQFSSLATKDDTMLCAYRRKQGVTWDVEVARIERDGTTTQVVITTGLSNTNVFPCMVQLPSGRINLYFWLYDDFRTRYQIRGYTSADDGASWSLLNRAVLRDVWTETLGTYSGTVNSETAGAGASGYSSVGRLTAAYIGGSVLLLAGLTRANTSLSNRNVLRQWASADLGCTFDLVESESTATAAATDREKHPVLVTAGREAYLVYIGQGNDVAWKVLTSAWQPTSEIDHDYLSVTDEVGQVAACRDDGGTVWVYALHDDSGAGADIRGTVYSSTDRMQSLVPHGIASYQTYWFDGLDATPSDGEILDISACFARGQTAIFHRHDFNASSYGDSLSVFYLGGWSTVQLPSFYVGVNSAQTRTSWQGQWCPVMGLADTDSRITVTGAGTSTITVNGENQIATTAGQQLYYEAAVNDYSVTARFHMRATSAPETNGQVGVRVVVSDGANDYDLQVRLSDTSLVVYDVNGTTTLATKTIALSAGLHILVSVNDSGDASVWYIEGDITDDQQWTSAYSGSALTSGAGTSSVVRWGNLAAVSAAATTSQWDYVAWNSDENMGAEGALAEGFAVSDLFGASVSRYPIYLVDGQRVASEAGPGYVDDRWRIPATYSYQIGNIFPDVSTSPSDPWRSTSTGVNNIAIDLTGATGNTWLMSPMVGLYLKGINWRLGTFQAYLNGTGWVNLASIDTATDFTSLPYTRRGNAIYPSSSFTPERVLRAGELVGCKVDLGSGKIRTITANTGGVWSTGSTVRPTIVFADDFDGTEPSSGTANVWYDEVLLVENIGADYYRGYRILVQSQTNLESYHEIGQAIVGPFFPFGTDCSWGYIRAQSANVTVSETAGRQRKARKLGEVLRSAAIAWTDGIDERLWQLMADDYVLGESGSIPAAYPGDTASLLEGLHAMLDGPLKPLVYVTGLDYNTNPWHVTDRSRVLYGRMMGDLEVSNVIGDEHEQVVQVQTIRIEEEA